MIWQILFLVFLGLLYILVKLCIKPKLAMRKYNNIKGVVVFPFVPLLGMFKQMQDHLKKTGDAYYFRKHVARQNPQMKALVTNIMGQVLILLTDPDLLKIYFTNQERYIKQQFFIDNRRRFFGNGLAFLQGEKWAKARKNWSQVFHFEFLNKSIPKIKKIINYQLQEVKNNSMKLDAIKFGASVAGVSVIQSFFAIQGNEKIQDMNIGAWIYKLVNDGVGAQQSMRHLFFGRKGLQFGLYQCDRDVNRRLKIYRAWALQQIKKKIQQNQQPNSNIIQILKDSKLVNTQQGFSTDQILEQFITFFAAGTDTTAHLICMSLYYLAKYPQYQDELRKQLARSSQPPTKIQQYNKFKYLDAIIMQTFRHYAYIDATFLRVSLFDHYIGQIPVPKGTLICPGWHENNFNPQIFDDVDTYNPDRWISPEKYKKLKPFAFTPFSTGPRSCIGQTFALLSAKILLWEIVSNFELKVSNDTLPLRFKFRSLYEPIDPVMIDLKSLN